MAKNKILKATTNSEIISYFINQNPEIASELDLPVQGESTEKYGKLIMDNVRYKNMFINTVNLIGLTVIKENRWENPWDNFTNKGTLRFGEQIREIIQDLAKVYDYNENYDNKTKFLETAVPDVYNYMHKLNFQKWYETTINESELRMAFSSEEDGLYKFIETTVANLYETYKYDKYLVDKYQLCRRIVDGTIPSVQITDYANKTARQVLSDIKAVSNLMTFKSPNYNPAGVRRATRFEDQYLMLDAQREAITNTEVIGTSFFRDATEVKTNLALIDTFTTTDSARLTELLGDAYVPFTQAEQTALATVVGLLIADDFFMDYYYALDNSPEGKMQTEWFNPTTLDRNVILHAWNVMSTSPFANCCVLVTEAPGVTSVSLNPATASISAGLDVQLTPTVVTTGFANKSVQYQIISAAGQTEANPVTVSVNGLVHIPADCKAGDIVVRAVSVYDDTVYGDATITVL